MASAVQERSKVKLSTTWVIVINRGTAHTLLIDRFMVLEVLMAESHDKAGSQAVSVDMDAMIDEILARKGPQKYQDGLSEDNWEQVGRPLLPLPPSSPNQLILYMKHVVLTLCI